MNELNKKMKKMDENEREREREGNREGEIRRNCGQSLVM